MDRILIWNDSKEKADALGKRLEKLSMFKVATAANMESVKDTINNSNISLLVINFAGHYSEKLKLIGYMTRHKWATPCIILISSPDFKTMLGNLKQQILHLMPKPVKFKELASSIMQALHMKDEGMAHTGMSLMNFLLLLELTEQTCRLEVRAPGSLKGYLYFMEGDLLDADYQGIHGEKAVSELICWTKVMVDFRALPKRRTRKKLKRDLREIIGPMIIQNSEEVVC